MPTRFVDLLLIQIIYTYCVNDHNIIGHRKLRQTTPQKEHTTS